MRYLTLVIGTDDPWSAMGESRFQTHPPHAERWDHFTIGGRYKGLLLLEKDLSISDPPLLDHPLPRRRATAAPFGLVDWEGMRREHLLSMKEFWVQVQKRFRDEFPMELFGLLGASTLEEFMKENDDPPCYAAILRGEWFGVTDPPSFDITREDKERWRRTWKDIRAQASKDDLVWVVDCHA